MTLELSDLDVASNAFTKRDRKAKIVATLGPTSSSIEMIRRLAISGVDVFRLNFSHGTAADHADVHSAIREIERELNYPIGILQDLQGPKIRIGSLNKKLLMAEAGSIVRFALTDKYDGSRIPLPHPEVFASVLPTDDILIDDGRIKLKVTSVESSFFDARVIHGGAITDRKGVNLPTTVLNLSAITDKDRADLNFGLNLGIDYVALSFVQKPADLLDARALIGGRAALVAKIEKPQAFDHLDDIIQLSDAIMIARGDLGVEIPPEDVPGRQKQLIRSCREAAKPVIVATQMLDSMVRSPSPTRAEASDVATAIYDGADAVMLSAESASGAFPVESVQMMDRIIRRTEQDREHASALPDRSAGIEATSSHAIAAAATAVAEAIDAPAIVAFTSSGVTAQRIARERCHIPLLAITHDIDVSRRLCLTWGSRSVLCSGISSYEEMVVLASSQLRQLNLARKGESAVIVAGIPFGMSGSTNNLRICVVQ